MDRKVGKRDGMLNQDNQTSADPMISETLARFVAELREEDIPAECFERSKQLGLDLMGSIIRASAESDSTKCLLASLETMGFDRAGDATIFGLDRTAAPPVAALANAMLGHSLDFDDTHAAASLHASAPVVPAALAVGEQLGSTGDEVLTAIICGYEVCCRLGIALDPTAHYARGFHPTATAGTFGAAAAVAKLHRLDADGVLTAFAISGSQAAGSLQFLANGAWNKRWQVGQAAMNGVMAAALAKNGFVGASEPIEGKNGFLQAYSDSANPNEVIAGLGSVWETMHIGVKLYPCCRYAHAALDALAQLVATHDLAADDFRKVTIGLHQNGVSATAEPLEKKRRPRGLVEGQFSMPFTAAIMMDRGSFDWDAYERLGDPAIDRLCDRVEIWRDRSLEGLRHPFGATISAETTKGNFEVRAEDPSGEPENFPEQAELIGKFLRLSQPVIGARAQTLAEAMMNLEKSPSLARDWFERADAA